MSRDDEEDGMEGVPTVVHTATMQSSAIRKHKWGNRPFVVGGLDIVRERAYFDYQREKVYVRTSKAIKASNRRKKRQAASKHRINRRIEIHCKACVSCGGKRLVEEQPVSRTITDLKFFNGGVRRWITRYESWWYRCTRCNATFMSPDLPHHFAKWGDGIMAWCVYQNVMCNQNMWRVRQSVKQVFGIDLPNITYRFRASVADRFRQLTDRILAELIRSPVLHADETGVRLINNGKGYVWVFASMDSVYYEYRESRKADFLTQRLEGFDGVLVSDFYTGYDSVECPQQKCIIHLIRDMNEDLLANPFDEELKRMFERFGELIQAVVETVDQRGLKSRYLRRHRRAIGAFLDPSVAKNQAFTSWLESIPASATSGF